MQRRLEVVDRRELVLSPIENAVAAVTAKNAELRDLISKFSSSDNVMKIDRLSMALQGVLDAAVNGGTAKVLTIRVSPAEFESHPPWSDDLLVSLYLVPKRIHDKGVRKSQSR